MGIFTLRVDQDSISGNYLDILVVCSMSDLRAYQLDKVRPKKADSSDSTKALLVDFIHAWKGDIHDHWFPNESKDTLAENS